MEKGKRLFPQDEDGGRKANISDVFETVYLWKRRDNGMKETGNLSKKKTSGRKASIPDIFNGMIAGKKFSTRRKNSVKKPVEGRRVSQISLSERVSPRKYVVTSE